MTRNPKSSTNHLAKKGSVLAVAVVLLALVGFFVYHAQKKDNNTHKVVSNAASVKAVKKATRTVAAPPAPTTVKANDFVVAEWGVKLNFPDATTVTYKLAASDTNQLHFYLQPSLAASARCQDLGLGITRSVSTDKSATASGSVKVGSYAYALSGSYTSCGGSTMVEELRSHMSSVTLPAAFKAMTATQ